MKVDFTREIAIAFDSCKIHTKITFLNVSQKKSFVFY